MKVTIYGGPTMTPLAVRNEVAQVVAMENGAWAVIDKDGYKTFVMGNDLYLVKEQTPREILEDEIDAAQSAFDAEPTAENRKRLATATKRLREYDRTQKKSALAATETDRDSSEAGRKKIEHLRREVYGAELAVRLAEREESNAIVAAEAEIKNAAAAAAAHAEAERDKAYKRELRSSRRRGMLM